MVKWCDYPLLFFLENPRANPRPNLDEIDSVDRVDVKLPDADRLPVIDPDDFSVTADVTEIDIQAAEEAASRGLNQEAARHHIHRRQRDHHELTKQRVLRGLRDSALPPESDFASPEDAARRQSLEKSINTIFSMEADSHGESRLEAELGAVLKIESIQDQTERVAAKNRYIAELARRLETRPEDAATIYQKLADQPEVYRALKQQRQVQLLIEHEPARYEEYIQLAKTGDRESLDAFVGSIENATLREQLSSLRAEETAVTEFIERRHAERMALSRETFRNSIPGYASLPDQHQVLLGRIAEQASPEFLSLVNGASLSGSEDGLAGQFLSRPFEIRNDGSARIGLADIHRFDATGIRQAAAIDIARSRRFKVFDELPDQTAAALLEPLLQFDRIESLPVQTDLNHVVKTLNALGLRTDIADGWLVLRDFQLLDDHSQPNPPGIRRLIQQLQALAGPSDPSVESIDSTLLRRILDFWDREGHDPRHSTILSPTEASDLPE